MIREIKAAAAAVTQLPQLVHSLAGAIQEASEARQVDEQLWARVDQLERTVRNVVAEAEALVTRAEGHLKAARAAEERARGMENRANRIKESLEGDEEGEDPFLAVGRAFQESNGGGGEGGRVRDVPGGVERPLTGKDAAKAFKYGAV